MDSEITLRTHLDRLHDEINRAKTAAIENWIRLHAEERERALLQTTDHWKERAERAEANLALQQIALDAYIAEDARHVTERDEARGEVGRLREELNAVACAAAGHSWGHYGSYRGKAIVLDEQWLERIREALGGRGE